MNSRVVWTADSRHKEGLEADGATEDVEVHQEEGAALYVQTATHPSLRGGAGGGTPCHLPWSPSLRVVSHLLLKIF